VDQLGGARGGAFREVALLRQRDGKAAPRRVAGDRRAVDSAADDEQVMEFLARGAHSRKAPSPPPCRNGFA